MNCRARLFFPLAALLAATPVAVHGQLTPPPQGKAITVEVARGGSVTIPLTGSDRQLRDLRFGIDRGPRHGKLGPLGKDSSRSASVRYTHGNDEDSTADSFVYTVRAGSGGTGRATVTIRIVDAAPVLAAPSSVDFGEIVLGETPVQSFQLANLGGGMIEGEVALPPPFQLETPGEFSLRRGQGRDFAVTFAPTKPGEFMQRITPSPADGSVIVFRGRALEPFQARPASTVLEAQADDSRSTSVLVTNRGLTNIVVQVSAPDAGPVRLPPEVAVPAGGSATVDLVIPPSAKLAVEDFAVTFATPDYKSEWMFSAPPIPARLEVVAPPDFGEVQPSRTSEATLVVRNTGGAHGHLRLHPGPFIRPAGNAEALDVAPGETREISLRLRLKKDELPPAEIPLEFNGAKSSVPIAARLADSEAPPQTAGEEPAAGQSAPDEPPPPTPALEPGVVLARAAGGTPRLEWEPQPGWTSLRLHRNGVPFTGYGNAELTAWQSLLALPARAIGFFSGLVNPGGRPRLPELDLSAVAPSEASQPGADLLPGEIGAPVIWQLMGKRGTDPAEHPAGARFFVGPQGVTALPDPRTAPVTNPRGRRIDASRDGAVVRLLIAHDPEVTAFRLEPGGLVVMPDGAEFIPLALEDSIEVATSVGHADGPEDKLTLLEAKLSGLPPGSSSAWRAVPLAGERPRPPTPFLLVRTAPPPPFPWTTVWLTLAALALGVLVYLRWRRTRLPS
jgi:hypothetical protein